MNYARIFKLNLKSVQNITVRQEYQSVLINTATEVCVTNSFYNFKNCYLNLLINSSKAWIVNFNNGNDNWNNKTNNNYVRCVK